MVQKVAVKREFEARLLRRLENSLSQPSSKWVPFFKLEKDKAAKGEGWAPPFVSCAQDSVGFYPPLPLRLLGYWKPLPFLLCTPITILSMAYFYSKKVN